MRLGVYIFCFSWIMGIHAQETPFEQFTKSSGLHSNTIYSLQKDQNGYLYIGTDNGLIRYNGNEFEDVIAPASPFASDVYDIRGYGRDSLLLSCEERNLIYVVRDSIYAHPYSNQVILESKNSVISDYHQAENGRLEVSFITYEPLVYPRERQLDYPIESLNFELKKDGDWVFFGRNPKGHHSEARGDAVQLVFNNQTMRISVDNVEKSLDHSIHRPPDKKQPMFSHGWNLFYWTGENLLQRTFDSDVTCMHLSTDSIIYVGTTNHGLYTLNTKFELIENKFNALENAFVTSVFSDSVSGLWVGTDQKGLFHFSNEQLKSEYLIEQNTVRYAGLFVIEDTLYRVSFMGEVTRYNLDNGWQEIERYKLPEANALYDISYNEQTGVVLGLDEESASILVWNSDMKLKDRDEEFNSGGKKLINIGGEVHILGWSNWLKYVQGSLGVFFITEPNNPTGATRVNDVALIDSQLVLATNIGVFAIPSSDAKARWSALSDLQAPVQHLQAIDEGIVAYSAGHGLTIVQRKSKFKGLLTDVLSHSKVRFLLTYGDLVYIATSDGLLSIDLRDLSQSAPNIVTELRGHVVYDMVHSAGYRYISTDRGMYRYPIDNAALEPAPVNIVINEISTSKGAVELLDHSFDYPLDASYLSLSFCGVDISNTGGFEYAYSCPEISKDWISMKNGEVLLSGLGPGEYTLRLRAKRVGSAHPSLEHYSFRVPYHFYERRIFWFALLGLTGLGVYVVQRWRTKRMRTELRKTHNRLNLSQQVLQARMNPHFVFNAMNTLKYDIWQGKQEEASEYISKFSKLLRQTFDYSRKSEIKLSNELDYLASYVALEQARIEGGFSFDIEIQSEIDINELMVPSLMLQPLIENAIWHGLAHSDHSKNIYLSITRIGDEVTVKLEDDGVGRDIAEGYKIKGVDDEEHAIDYLNERLSLLNKLTQQRYSLHIADGCRGGRGTTCILVFPLKRTTE